MRGIASVALFLQSACAAGAISSSPTPRVPLAAPASSLAPASGEPLVSRPELLAQVFGPSTARYQPEVIGTGALGITVRISNAGTRPVAVDRFEMSFETTREGVAFPCREISLGAGKPRDPNVLSPGQSHRFERALHCRMPIPGMYEVRVFVKFLGPSETRDLAGTFRLDLVAGQSRTPHPIPSLPGLHVGMVGKTAVPPMPADAWERGDYSLRVGFINGTGGPVALRAGRLVVDILRDGVSVPCPMELRSRGVEAKAEINSGEATLVSLPVRCDLGREGTYVLLVRFETANGADTVGQLAVRVTSEPTPAYPYPLCSGDIDLCY
ncbi:MAG: hypothetical protein WCI05_01895 [Myxococcales bacterium]